MIDDTKAANSGLFQPLSLRELHVHEVETVERMIRVLDAAVHVHAAAAARVTLDRGRRIDDGEPSVCSP